MTEHATRCPGAAEATPELPENEVHVWYARVDALAEELPYWMTLLSPEERVRAERFRFQRDRCQFCVSRSVLRCLLGAYCRVPSSEIAFAYSASGKPALAGPPGQPDLQFNLAHSHALAVYAFVRGRKVGVDVEFERELPAADRIAARYFADEEIAAYRSLPAAARRRGFFNAWTRKEAFVKALGAGLGHPLDSFVVSLGPEEPARFLHFRDEPAAVERWTLWDLALDPSYVAALAVEGTELHVRTRFWSTEVR